jgi:Protein of unknown function (DUF3800)
VIYGYFDGSNTHDGSKLISLCGFLADPRIWDDFDHEWQKVLDKRDWPRRPSELHMYDCVHGFKEFDGWTLAQRLALFGDLSGVVAASNVLALGSVFLVEAFTNRSIEEKAILAKGGLYGPMDFVFQLLVQMAITQTHKYANAHEPPITEKLSLIFDEEPPNVAERYRRLYNHHCAKHPRGDMLTGISFARSRDLSPIQAADMLAYTTYHWELKRQFPGASDFNFPIIPGFLRLIEGVAADGGTYDDVGLGRLLITLRINEANKNARRYL